MSIALIFLIVFYSLLAAFFTFIAFSLHSAHGRANISVYLCLALSVAAVVLILYDGCVFNKEACLAKKEVAKVKEMEHNKLCFGTPKLITEVDGVKLYKIYPNGCNRKPVYFTNNKVVAE